jgi:O-acetyl-ADP-ribose deacetylase (regulator of RNase III)
VARNKKGAVTARILSMIGRMNEDIPNLSPFSNAQRVQTLRIVHGELLEQTDLQALVSFLTEDLSWGGPVNQLLLKAAGPRLDEYVLGHIIKPKSGDVYLAPAFGLPFKYLIFCIIPKWKDGLGNEEKLLRSCYRNAIELAAQNRIGSVGVPALGSGRSDFPLRRAARLAITSLKEAVGPEIEEVRIVCKSRESFDTYREIVGM